MRLTTPQLTSDNINFAEHDALNRRPFGEVLLNLITRTKDELVICLDAPWGEGKTTFVKMWQNLLKKNQIQSIYFDAFANDYIDDAFIALASHIVSFAEKSVGQDNPAKKKINDFKKKASEVGVQLLSWGAKLGIKAATLGIIKDSDIDELSEIKNDIAKGTSNVTSKFIEDRISAHHTEIETISSFQEMLSQFANDINENSGKPLVIIIDELDRCKPTYSVEVIEKIKHVFSVKNIIFLLVLHKQQLEEAIKSVYGPGIDASIYLQKFINVNCTLPKNRDATYTNDYKKYCDKLFDLHELNVYGDRTNLIESISLLARHLDLSLRQLEKAFTNLSIFYASVSENYPRLTHFISLLAIVRVVNHDLYIKLKNKETNFTDLQETLHFPKSFTNSDEDRKLSRFIEWTQFCLFTDDEYNASSNKETFDRMYERLWESNWDRVDIIPFYCNLFDMFTVN